MITTQHSTTVSHKRNQVEEAIARIFFPNCENLLRSCEEVETLAQEIAGPAVNPETQQLARKIAEVQIDLRAMRAINYCRAH